MRIFLFHLLFWVTFVSPKLWGEDLSIQQAISGAQYVFCFDGGGSKTELVVLDQNGERVMLMTPSQSVPSDLLLGPSSNLTTATAQELRECMAVFFHQLELMEKQIPASAIISNSAFVGGFAGGARTEKTQVLKEIVEDLGFKKDRMVILSDAALALELVDDDGGILIGGTGSICFFKNKGDVIRVGGLGYRIADEGSGYDIGLKGIRAAIEQEYAYGEPTSIGCRLIETFDIENPKHFIATINHNQESPKTISSVAKIVFEEAWNGDEVAMNILNNAADALADLVYNALKQVDIETPPIYLIGGLFKNEHADQFIQMMANSPSFQKLLPSQRPLLVNMAQSLVVEQVVRLALINNAL